MEKEAIEVQAEILKERFSKSLDDALPLEHLIAKKKEWWDVEEGKKLTLQQIEDDPYLQTVSPDERAAIIEKFRQYSSAGLNAGEQINPFRGGKIGLVMGPVTAYFGYPSERKVHPFFQKAIGMLPENLRGGFLSEVGYDTEDKISNLFRKKAVAILGENWNTIADNVFELRAIIGRRKSYGSSMQDLEGLIQTHSELRKKWKEVEEVRESFINEFGMRKPDMDTRDYVRIIRDVPIMITASDGVKRTMREEFIRQLVKNGVAQYDLDENEKPKTTSKEADSILLILDEDVAGVDGLISSNTTIKSMYEKQVKMAVTEVEAAYNFGRLVKIIMSKTPGSAFTPEEQSVIDKAKSPIASTLPNNEIDKGKLSSFLTSNRFVAWRDSSPDNRTNF